jgi:hypothetical protein
MEPIRTLAIAIDLHVISTAEGGRQTPLLGGCAPANRFTYRPNWGLPGWANCEQTAGPVLGFSRVNVQPGEDTRAVVVPLFIDRVPGWREVQPGDVLRMYEGSRVCGRGIVYWVEPATWPMPTDKQECFARWLSGLDD